MCQEHAHNGETYSHAHTSHDHKHVEYDHEHDASAHPHAHEAGYEDVHKHEPMTAPEALERRRKLT
jgi:hypothetical protein